MRRDDEGNDILREKEQSRPHPMQKMRKAFIQLKEGTLLLLRLRGIEEMEKIQLDQAEEVAHLNLKNKLKRKNLKTT